jgi:signal transduction histidine kinase
VLHLARLVRDQLSKVPVLYFDLALATTILLAGQITADVSASPWLRIVGIGFFGLAFRRRWPIAVFVITLLTALSIGDATPYVATAALGVATYAAGLYSRHRRITAALLLAACLAIVGVFGGGLPTVPPVLGPFLVLVPFWLAGNALRFNQLRADLFETKANRLETEQEQARQAAILEDRGRISRELHDVIAHSVSVMVVQAGAARELLKSAADAPQEATESLLAVESSGREALTELRHMLGALSADRYQSTVESTAESAFGAGVAPQPGLDQLETLIKRLREAGQPVELRVTGKLRPLPKGIEIAAYRVVQEALTNALKHAKGALTDVTLSYGDDELWIEVIDEGRGAGSSHVTPGRGLAGMRERISVFGGRLEAGPRQQLGYAVKVWLPIDDEPR